MKATHEFLKVVFWYDSTWDWNPGFPILLRLQSDLEQQNRLLTFPSNSLHIFKSLCFIAIVKAVCSFSSTALKSNLKVDSFAVLNSKRDLTSSMAPSLTFSKKNSSILRFVFSSSATVLLYKCKTEGWRHSNEIKQLR